MAKKHLHEKRGISFVELGAMLGVRELLKQGLMEFTGSAHGMIGGQHEFHMACTIQEDGDCGSIGCIGGTMGMLMGMGRNQAHNYVMSHHSDDYMAGRKPGDPKSPLTNLFYPPMSRNWNKATPAKAIQAIDNWLKTGKANWLKLLPPDKYHGGGE